MLNKPQSDPVAASLKSLAGLTFAIAVSRASPIPQSVSARGMGITSPNEDRMTLKNILDWLFVAAAVVVVGSTFVWRTLFLRARGRPLRDFFAFIEAPQQRGGLPQGSIQPNYCGLTHIPPNRETRGQTSAADTDPEGRREGVPDPDDTNGDHTGRDVLPAYEVKGGPPNYNQFLAVDLGTGTNARLQVTGTVSPQSQSLGVRSGTPPQISPTLDARLPRPPPPSYCPGLAASHPDP